MDMHKEFLRLKDENERLKQQALADDLAMEAAAERDNAEIRRLLEALKEVLLMVEAHMHLDHVDDAVDLIDKALEGEYVEP